MVFIWKGPNGLMGEGHTLGGKRPGECVDLTEALAAKVKAMHGEASLEPAPPPVAPALELEPTPVSEPTPRKKAPRKAPSRKRTPRAKS